MANRGGSDARDLTASRLDPLERLHGVGGRLELCCREILAGRAELADEILAAGPVPWFETTSGAPMVNVAGKSHRESVPDGHEAAQLPPPSSRAKALPLQLPPCRFVPGSCSIPAPLLDELVYREYWTERAWQEGERAEAASIAAGSGALRREPLESVAEPARSPKPVRTLEADPSFEVGEDPWGLAR